VQMGGVSAAMASLDVLSGGGGQETTGSEVGDKAVLPSQAGICLGLSSSLRSETPSGGSNAIFEASALQVWRCKVWMVTEDYAYNKYMHLNQQVI